MVLVKEAEGQPAGKTWRLQCPVSGVAGRAGRYGRLPGMRAGCYGVTVTCRRRALGGRRRVTSGSKDGLTFRLLFLLALRFNHNSNFPGSKNYTKNYGLSANYVLELCFRGRLGSIIKNPGTPAIFQPLGNFLGIFNLYQNFDKIPKNLI